ncbi:MAG TPA: hypothetical protein DCQ26_02515 [Marinilabiliales bacterium]|nr:MAG: hypothetical protein A2W84_14530 [Bacteroidetes bacterium GWC2_40_13]OFX71493.1 MAG: hypothetical protein A2W96_03035 [Bacteroidetes bacterium GWD2_40_43]OFX89450.1 MAG: hypothetical protein A2W97_13930 [Bacteroidetes bacterium GWE2_40_63]OFY23276.1 MAG: hypothetical protein A2W88_19590 [Bacteroidetes bacterium GWF2_40_13]OFZ28115.1 MAG: hypothetical protein A2437_04405 [Bacteroidetes bacterium RIFOXYC2_FULL_40_12]HAM97461.1 hypothetical protein [Marinilabiliales bacterium]
MEPTRTLIIDKAARIIMNSGLEALTIPNLEKEVGVGKNQLNNHLTKDDDILLVLLVCFETELNSIVQEITNKGIVPETELQLLFKRLYALFLLKPYYLSIIFDKNLAERDDAIKISIQRIINIAETYLSTIIEAGKTAHTFKTKVSTKLLVNKILSRFRIFMKDEQLVHEMILELKNLKNQNNEEGN